VHSNPKSTQKSPWPLKSNDQFFLGGGLYKIASTSIIMFGVIQPTTPTPPLYSSEELHNVCGCTLAVR